MSDIHGITPENLLRNLPTVLQADDDMRAVATAVADILAARPDEIGRLKIYAQIDAMSEELLDILAVDFKVDWYDFDFTLEEKRQTIKDSWFVHRRLGTKGAVERALSAIYDGSKVLEWFTYNGDPYHFKLIIPVDETTLDPKKHGTVLSLIDFYKNLRSVLDDIEYHGAASEASVYVAAAFAGCEIIDSAIAVNH